MKRLLIPLFFLLLLVGYPFIELYAVGVENYFNPQSYIQKNGAEPETTPHRAPAGNKAPKRREDGEVMNDNKLKGSRPPIDSNSAKKKAVVTNHDSLEVLVNKSRTLSAEYAPSDLTIPNIPFSFPEESPKKLMRKEAANALEMLFAQAEREGIDLKGVSAYRSYERQEVIFDHNVKVKGETEANKFSARPGESEHQTGLAIDVSSPFIDCQLIEEFGETKEGKWLEEKAHKYGFIIRYPKGKEKITGYQYEPWHLRYVGMRTASEINKKGLTLEEYFSS